MMEMFELLNAQDNLAYAMSFPAEFSEEEYKSLEQAYVELNDEIALAKREYERGLD